MKLFLCALITFLITGCESYHKQNADDIQEQQEREKQEPNVTFPDKGGNAGNR